ncbi:MAG: ABC transporter [Flavobacteriales bacterium]|nr:ABC transporter [Flavobacteriales bacterium]|tara:strand:- start:20610 stop:22379 length:1770 start_codon:yes stop_codon:yes gene_type:complete
MQELKHLNKYFIKYKYKLFIGFVFIILANVFALFPANLIGKSFDVIINEINITKNDLNSTNNLNQLLFKYSILLVICALIKGLFMFFMRQTIIVVSRNIEFDLKNDIYFKYQQLSTSFYNKNNTGDLINRITEDVSKVRMYLGPGVMYSANLVTLIILILCRMISVSPLLTFIIIFPLPILSFLIFKVSKNINLKSNIAQQRLSSLTNLVQQSFSGIRLVKSFVNESKITNMFSSLSENYMSDNIKLSKVNSTFFPLVLLLVGASVILTVYTGGILVIQQKITIGNVAEFIIYINMLTWPVTSVGWVTEVVQRASASQKRINIFLHNNDYSVFHSTKDLTKPKNKINTNIEFKNISFKYDENELYALKSINLVVQANQIVGFVGGVGSGKSTIMKLLSGMIQTSKGDLFYDGYSSKVLNWSFFRSNISYVSQDIFLFSDTIRNNILFGNNLATEDEIINICKHVCILDEIKSFKNGLDTYIGEGGVTLSGGQKQRIALARALIKKPKILLLDDALSNVDINTERNIMKYIEQVFDSSLVIITSNRLSVLEFCHHIHVLNKGFVVESGRYFQLLKNKGEFYNIFFKQLDA